MKAPILLVISLICFVLSSCKTYSDEDLKNFDNQIEAYIEFKGLKMESSSSGLHYIIEKEGEGELIKYTDIVSFTYDGKLLNGETFDKQTEPVTFKVSDLIGAWKEIMLQLKPGSKAFLICPPQLGYGDRKLDKIPPHSILTFTIEVNEVK